MSRLDVTDLCYMWVLLKVQQQQPETPLYSHLVKPPRGAAVIIQDGEGRGG